MCVCVCVKLLPFFLFFDICDADGREVQLAMKHQDKMKRICTMFIMASISSYSVRVPVPIACYHVCHFDSTHSLCAERRTLVLASLKMGVCVGCGQGKGQGVGVGQG